MADHVCCMCGDVGFPDKLFSCKRCLFRFQHSYCSSYVSEPSSQRLEICDWCQSELPTPSSSAKSSFGGSSSRRSLVRSDSVSGERPIKRHQEEVSPTAALPEKVTNGKSSGGTPSPRQSARRYKLLKDVMC